MSTTSSLAAIGHRLHILGDQYIEADARALTLAAGSAEYMANDATMSRLLDEEIALRDLVLTMRPRTLEDVAVQLGVLFLHLSHMTDCKTSKKDLKLGIRRAKLVAAGLTTVVCRLAWVDPADAGEPDLGELLQHHGRTQTPLPRKSAPEEGGTRAPQPTPD